MGWASGVYTHSQLTKVEVTVTVTSSTKTTRPAIWCLRIQLQSHAPIILTSPNTKCVTSVSVSVIWCAPILCCWLTALQQIWQQTSWLKRCQHSHFVSIVTLPLATLFPRLHLFLLALPTGNRSHSIACVWVYMCDLFIFKKKREFCLRGQNICVAIWVLCVFLV